MNFITSNNTSQFPVGNDFFYRLLQYYHKSIIIKKKTQTHLDILLLFILCSWLFGGHDFFIHKVKSDCLIQKRK